MPDFAHVTPGQALTIPAADYNGAMDAAKAFRKLGVESSRDATAGPLVPGLDVFVRNDTGGDLPAFVPVRLGATLTGLAATPDPLPYESRDRPLFAGLECDGTGVHVVTQEAIPEDAIGRAVVQGVTVARVASGLAAGDACQPPASGNVELVAGGSFAKVLTAPTGSGDRLALVLIGTGGGGGSGYIVVRPTANGAGDGTYVDAVIQQRNATTGAWEDGVETVSFRPYWTGMKQKQNLLWRCEDTGVRDGEDQRQVEGIIAPLIARQVMVEWECTSGETTKTYATVWVPDVL